jgi:hypothetical protein
MMSFHPYFRVDGKLLIGISALLLIGACRPTSDSGALDSTGSSKITMSLAHPHVLADEDFELVFSAMATASELGLCVVKRADEVCNKSTQGYAGSKLIYANSTRNFFQMLHPALLDDGLIFRVVAFDRSGGIADQRDIELKWTGSGPAPGERKGASGVAPSPTPSGLASGPNPSGLPGLGAPTGGASSSLPGIANGAAGGAAGSAAIVQVIQRNCGGCHNHNSYVSNPDLMKSTNSAERIRSGNMPPPGSRNMSAADSQALLGFLGQ